MPPLIQTSRSSKSSYRPRGASTALFLLVATALVAILWHQTAGGTRNESTWRQLERSSEALSGDSLRGKARVVNGVAMLPMRDAFQALGAEVTYDRKKDRAVAQLPGATVTLRPGAQRVMIDEQPFLMTTPSRFIDGTLYVSRRFVQETALRGDDVASVEL